MTKLEKCIFDLVKELAANNPEQALLPNSELEKISHEVFNDMFFLQIIGYLGDKLGEAIEKICAWNYQNSLIKGSWVRYLSKEKVYLIYNELDDNYSILKPYELVNLMREEMDADDYDDMIKRGLPNKED